VAEAKYFAGRTIKRMELLVLSTLKWRMQAVTACSFIDYFLHKFSDCGAPSMLALSRSTDLILSTAKGMSASLDLISCSIHEPACRISRGSIPNVPEFGLQELNFWCSDLQRLPQVLRSLHLGSAIVQ
jgi:hypothetical protein